MAWLRQPVGPILWGLTVATGVLAVAVGLVLLGLVLRG